MKYFLSYILLLATSLTTLAAGYAKSDFEDLVLIYQGATYRIPWTKQQFVPYITHQFADGKREWTFDSFLFLDFEDGMGHTFITHGNGTPANKEQWQWYANRLFENGRSLSALDAAIDSMKQAIGDPGFKHKIVLTIPIPYPDFKDWGSVNNKKLNFEKTSHMKKAVEWWVDMITERFNQQGYRNLELVGFYWTDENVKITGNLPKQIASKVKKKGLKFIWIPYFNAPGWQNWKKLGFDIAYLQPNYFSKNGAPANRVDMACDIAYANDMGLEYEFDGSTLQKNKPVYIKHFKAYLDTFERRGVFNNCALCYYTDSKHLIDFTTEKSPELRQLVDRLMRHIADRRKSAKTATQKKASMDYESLKNAREVRF